MALSSCPECGTTISTEATRCPHCGIENPWGNNLDEQTISQQNVDNPKLKTDLNETIKIYQIGQGRKSVGCGEAVTSIGVIITICFTIPFLILLFTGL